MPWSHRRNIVTTLKWPLVRKFTIVKVCLGSNESYSGPKEYKNHVFILTLALSDLYRL